MKRKNQDAPAKAYRFLIKPTDEQKVQFAKTFGCCRFIWNRMLADKKQYYNDTGETLYVTPATYKSIPDLDWLNEVDSLALANVQLNLETAYKRFFENKSGFPKFKKKHKSTESYTTNCVNGNITFANGLLKLPKLKEPVKVIQHRPIMDGGKLKSVTITKEPNGKYYASILFEYEAIRVDYSPNMECAVGLDMSMQELFVSSDGELGDYPHFFRKMQNRLAIEQRKLSHMKRGSNNYVKQQIKVAKLHAKVKHQRENFLHHVSKSLAERYDIVCIEDLDMRAMSQCLNLGKSVMDNGWGMFVNMLAYKLKERGKLLIKIDKWFPSSKTCSACGHKHDSLTLNDRIFICPQCGNTIDRDLQAAKNILKEGLRICEAGAL